MSDLLSPNDGKITKNPSEGLREERASFLAKEVAKEYNKFIERIESSPFFEKFDNDIGRCKDDIRNSFKSNMQYMDLVYKDLYDKIDDSLSHQVSADSLKTAKFQFSEDVESFLAEKLCALGNREFTDKSVVFEPLSVGTSAMYFDPEDYDFTDFDAFDELGMIFNISGHRIFSIPDGKYRIETIVGSYGNFPDKNPFLSSEESIKSDILNSPQELDKYNELLANLQKYNSYDDKDFNQQVFSDISSCYEQLREKCYSLGRSIFSPAEEINDITESIIEEFTPRNSIDSKSLLHSTSYHLSDTLRSPDFYGVFNKLGENIYSQIFDENMKYRDLRIIFDAFNAPLLSNPNGLNWKIDFGDFQKKVTEYCSNLSEDKLHVIESERTDVNIDEINFSLFADEINILTISVPVLDSLKGEAFNDFSIENFKEKPLKEYESKEIEDAWDALKQVKTLIDSQNSDELITNSLNNYIDRVETELEAHEGVSFSEDNLDLRRYVSESNRNINVTISQIKELIPEASTIGELLLKDKQFLAYCDKLKTVIAENLRSVSDDYSKRKILEKYFESFESANLKNTGDIKFSITPRYAGIALEEDTLVYVLTEGVEDKLLLEMSLNIDGIPVATIDSYHRDSDADQMITTHAHRHWKTFGKYIDDNLSNMKNSDSDLTHLKESLEVFTTLPTNEALKLLSDNINEYLEIFSEELSKH